MIRLRVRIRISFFGNVLSDLNKVNVIVIYNRLVIEIYVQIKDMMFFMLLQFDNMCGVDNFFIFFINFFK